MPVCIALILVCFGTESSALQRAELCLYLAAQIDKDSLFRWAKGVAKDNELFRLTLEGMVGRKVS